MSDALFTTAADPGCFVSIIDESHARRQRIVDSLRPVYRLSHHPSLHGALPALRNTPPNIVLIDDRALDGSADTIIRSWRQDPHLAPVMLLVAASSEAQADALRRSGADATIAKPYRSTDLLSAIAALRGKANEQRWRALPPTAQAALRQTLDLCNRFADSLGAGFSPAFREVLDACQPLVEAVSRQEYRALLAAVKDHDDYSYVHSLRVATLMTLLGRTMGLDSEALPIIASGGLLHDVGKLSIPQHVLNKPGPLDAAEIAVMQKHSLAGVSVLKSSLAAPTAVLTMVEQHHEKLDGSGYPHGLKAHDLNDLVRMTVIVDIFSAMTDHRVYRAAMQPETALAIMTGEMRDQVDQALLARFGRLLLDAVT